MRKHDTQHSILYSTQKGTINDRQYGGSTESEFGHLYSKCGTK